MKLIKNVETTYSIKRNEDDIRNIAKWCVDLDCADSDNGLYLTYGNEHISVEEFPAFLDALIALWEAVYE